MISSIKYILVSTAVIAMLSTLTAGRLARADCLCFDNTGSMTCKADEFACGSLGHCPPNPTVCPGPENNRTPLPPIAYLPKSLDTDYKNCLSPQSRDVFFQDKAVSCKQAYDHDLRGGQSALLNEIPITAHVVASFCMAREGGSSNLRPLPPEVDNHIGYAKFTEPYDRIDKARGVRMLQMTFMSWHPSDGRDSLYEVYYTLSASSPRESNCKADPPQGSPQ